MASYSTNQFKPGLKIMLDGVPHNIVENEMVKPRLVVLDPSSVVARLLERYLGGAEIVQAGALDTAVEEITQTPSMALLINDPRGPEHIDRLMQMGAIPYNLPVIACHVPGSQQASDELGVMGYLVKPVSQARLLEALEALKQPVHTILLVDDEADVLQLFRRMLTSAGRGYRVLRASDGRQALRILKRQAVDVILVDLVMPLMGGLEFLAAIKQDPRIQNVPVILISARDPQGQAVVSQNLVITRSGGLSANKLLTCIQALIQILSPVGESVDLKSPEIAPG